MMLKMFLLLGVALYLFLLVIAYLISDRLIFLPPVSSYTDEDLPVVMVPTEDGAEIATLYLSNPDASHTILFSHGNAEDLGHLLGFLEQIRQAGFAVIAFDYRGYGLSTGGPPGAKAAYRDEAAVYHYTTRKLGIPPSQLVLHGRSVGSGPAIDLATRKPVAGLIVESGFVSAFRVLTHVTLLPFDKFPNLRNIRNVRCPVLVIHGTQDEVIQPWHGRQLFAAAPEPKRMFWVNGAGHNDILWVAGEEYGKELCEFAQTLRHHAPLQP